MEKMEKTDIIQHNYCEGCGRLMALSYKQAICPTCIEQQLFDKVRDYVRTYEVNEYDVANHFDITVRQVRGWIKEGRMEYKERDEKSALGGSVCFRCGAKVNFGTLCAKCLKLLNGEGRQGVAKPQPGEEGRMRFVDKEDE